MFLLKNSRLCNIFYCLQECREIKFIDVGHISANRKRKGNEHEAHS